MGLRLRIRVSAMVTVMASFHIREERLSAAVIGVCPVSNVERGLPTALPCLVNAKSFA
jgi:hypothetical protein